MNKTVLIIGGYGVFGGRLAKALSKDGRFRVIVAGRNKDKAQRFCKGTDCEAAYLDRTSGDLAQKVRNLSPFIVIDAAGPFQNYDEQSHRMVEVAIACGAHYLDLSDDADFTLGIAKFEDAARKSELVVLSGVSSVPALSSAIVSALSEGLQDIHLIESAILPGNRAPRGLSVVKAIVSQVGRPLEIWTAGRTTNVPGWSGLKRVTVDGFSSKPALNRWSSLIGAPDLKLFPSHFGARNVAFRASLDLKLMHGGLWLLSWLVRFRLMNSILPLAAPLKFAADRLEGFGSDVGAMVVKVAGTDKDGRPRDRRWTLIVEDGDGPSIPTIPAQILCGKLIDSQIAPGARACLEEFSRVDAETALQLLKVQTCTSECAIPLVFQTVLGEDFNCLQPPLRDLHTVVTARRWQGRAQVKRSRGSLSRLAGWFAGFPSSAEDIAVEVEMRKTAKGETWIRTFGKKRFRSYLSSQNQKGVEKLYERFGPMRFEISLKLENGELNFPVKSGRVFGLPLPRFMLPMSNAKEYLDQKGRACFFVEISLPITGHVATYSGWLEPIG